MAINAFARHSQPHPNNERALQSLDDMTMFYLMTHDN